MAVVHRRWYGRQLTYARCDAEPALGSRCGAVVGDQHSLAAIAAMLGVSKQTAQARYGQPPRQLENPNKAIDGLTEG